MNTKKLIASVLLATLVVGCSNQPKKVVAPSAPQKGANEELLELATQLQQTLERASRLATNNANLLKELREQVQTNRKEVEK